MSMGKVDDSIVMSIGAPFYMNVEAFIYFILIKRSPDLFAKLYVLIVFIIFPLSASYPADLLRFIRPYRSSFFKKCIDTFYSIGMFRICSNHFG